MVVPPLMMSLDEIIPREKWGSHPPNKLAPALRKPIWTVAFVYTETETCRSRDECIVALQRLQNYHMARGMYDIPYNFILGGDLQIYEGRGWNTTVPTPWQIEDLPYSTLVIARVGPMADNYKKASDDFVRGYDIIHFGQLKLLIESSFELKLIYSDWNRHEVVHGFQCDWEWPSIINELLKKNRDFLKFIRQP